MVSVVFVNTKAEMVSDQAEMVNHCGNPTEDGEIEWSGNSKNPLKPTLRKGSSMVQITKECGVFIMLIQ